MLTFTEIPGYLSMNECEDAQNQPAFKAYSSVRGMPLLHGKRSARGSAKPDAFANRLQPFLPDSLGVDIVSNRKIISSTETKERQDIFIAGRGGETNLHGGNHIFRQRVLEHTETYAKLRTCDRGKKFARWLFEQYLSDVTFVIRHSYFFKNLQKGTISKEKIESVKQEHGGSFDSLKHLPADYYFTVGETWILGIISDIVRFGGKKLTTIKKRKTTNNEFSLATVSDDESVAPPSKRRPEKRLRQYHAVDSSPPFDLPTDRFAASDMTSSNTASESLADQVAELESLVKMPLPSAEDEASMIAKDEMILDFLGDSTAVAI